MLRDISIYSACSAIALWLAGKMFPTFPKIPGWFGVGAALILIVAGETMPQLQVTLPVIALFIGGAIAIGFAAHLAFGPAVVTPSGGKTMAEPKPKPEMGDNNTLVDVEQPGSMGSGNTIVRTIDPNGKTILNKGGVAIGAGAQADSTSVAIGAGAGAGQSTSGKNSPIINAPTSNTHFGDVTVVGKPQRHITDATKQGLLQIDKSKPVSVLYRNGDAEAANLAQEIYDFLKSAGYQVQPDGIGWHSFGLQPQDITISPFNGGAETHVKTESRR